MSSPTPAPDDRLRFIVCGDNPMAYRLIDELVRQYDAEVTVVVPDAAANWAPKIAELPQVRLVESARLDEPTFRRAGVTEASALGLLDQDDAHNIDAALIAQELNPRLRLVVRMFNQSLGERISKLLDDCVMLSAAAIAAPAFVAAALDEASSPLITVGDRTVVATDRASVAAQDVLASLAVTADRLEPELLPDDDRGDLVLATSRAPARPRRPARHSDRLSVMAILLSARLRVILAVLLVLFVAGTVALAALNGLDRSSSWIQAAYVAILTELGGADINPAARGAEKITLVLLSIVSIALIPALTAAIVDSAIKARLRRESGGPTRPVADHIVVVGLGHVGTRVIRSLDEMGIEVVAIERSANAHGVKVARDLGIPVIIGDASRAEVLESAHVGHARALIVASTDDVTNLEISLLGRAAKPDLRVVLRLFDGEFANRVQRAFNINISRSVSYLAAPAFAAAMLGRQIIATIPIRRRVLLVAELPVGAGSALEGATAGDINRPHLVRLIAVRSSQTEHAMWAVPPGRRLNRSDQLVVVATRAGLGSLLADTAERPIDADVPYRLLDPAERPTAPHAREATTSTDSAERTGGHPPVGPADATGNGAA